MDNNEFEMTKWSNDFDEALNEINSKFDELDVLYQDCSLFNDEKIIGILQAHRTLESRYVPEGSSETPKEVGVLGEYFHKENIETIDYLLENIDNGYQKLDALIFMYSHLIYRYSRDNTNFPLPTVQKLQGYLDKIRLNFSGNHVNVGELYASLMRFNTIRNLHSYSQEFVDQMVLVNDKNMLFVFRFCCVLMYDREFCRSVYHYEGTLHRGAFILFDTVLFRVLKGRSADKMIWTEKFVNFFEKNAEIQFDPIPAYYLTYAKLFRCFYVSCIAENINDELKCQFNNIILPDFETSEKTYTLYYLYREKLNCLENFGEYEKIIEICDYMLQILNQGSLEIYSNIIERLNWIKYDALKLVDCVRHSEWYFEVIKTASLSKIKNKAYLSPFMKQGDDGVQSLFHFSDLNALKSIIENKALWLTRYDFLNDTEEIRYISNVITIEMESIKGSDKFKEFLNGCLNTLEAYFDGQHDGDMLAAIKDCTANIYVLSTSIKPDNLSLWHYYSGGTGCSVKVDPMQLHNQIKWMNTAVSSKNAQVFMRKIDYEYSFQSSELLETLNVLFQNAELSPEQKLFIGCIHIIYEGIFTKNPNMAQEEEFRVAVIVGNALENPNTQIIPIIPKFRVSKNTFIPYIELKIEPLTLISEICIAPLNKIDIAKKGLMEFLAHNGFESLDEIVTVSDIKLRY